MTARPTLDSTVAKDCIDTVVACPMDTLFPLKCPEKSDQGHKREQGAPQLSQQHTRYVILHTLAKCVRVYTHAFFVLPCSDCTNKRNSLFGSIIQGWC
jgi:hypothetical protein